MSQDVLFLALCIALANSSNLVLRKFCGVDVTTFERLASTLLLSVNGVIAVCSKPEMRRIYAISDVTCVANQYAIWDRAIMQFIRKTMCAHLFYWMRKAKLPVSSACNCSDPQPAFVRAALIYGVPKAFYGRKTSMMTRSKMNRLPFNVSALAIVFIGDAYFSTAATFAITVGDFFEGKLELDQLWGMLWHVNSPFMTLTTPRDACKASPWQLYFCPDYSTERRNIQLDTRVDRVEPEALVAVIVALLLLVWFLQRLGWMGL